MKICRILEGMPLGIELAAAWSRMLSCPEIYSEIEKNIDFLSTPARDLPERHQSMSAVFEHSWRMLDEKEQRAMIKLSVFRGGFKREAAEQVTGADLTLLLTLTSKSLIRKTPGDRYDMHELLRQFVAHKLQESPDEEANTRSCHSTYFLRWMRESNPALMSQRQREVLAEMTSEISNLRSAWEYAIQDRQISLMVEAAWPIFYLHELRSLFSAGEKIFLQAARRIQNENEDSLCVSSTAYLEAFRGYLAARQGRVIEANQILQDSVETLARQGDSPKYAIALLFSGIVLRYTGEPQKAFDHFCKAHQLADGVDPWVHCASAVMTGVAGLDLGQLGESIQWLEKGLNLCRAVGEPAILAYALSSLIQAAGSMGRIEQAELFLEEGLRLSVQTEHHFTRAMLLEQWARLSFANGEYIKAKAMGEESIRIFRELNDMWHLSRALTMMGRLEMSSGDAVRAEGFFIEAVEIALEDHLYLNLFEAVLEIGAGLKNHDDALLVRRLTWFILQHPGAARDVIERARQLELEVGSQLSPGQLGESLSEADGQHLETVVKEILRRAKSRLGR